MQKNNSENEAVSREELKKQLKWGDINLIAKVAGVGRSTVERFFQSENDNAAVQKTVDTLLEKRGKKISDQLNELL